MYYKKFSNKEMEIFRTAISRFKKDCGVIAGREIPEPKDFLRIFRGHIFFQKIKILINIIDIYQKSLTISNLSHKNASECQLFRS